ncbi:MAG: N-acetylmuramoyl-L-alanine amidase [Deltaproteobacteria bacterium]|nr:N-acetylmuramoyl-L-alanine amidase [Deltaproteobacteria bacterium]
MGMIRINGAVAVLLSLVFLFLQNQPAYGGFSKAARRTFQRSIIDMRGSINRRFKKVRRKETKYIIVHTSEAGLRSTLRAVSKGKRTRRGYRTHGGHAHYVIARNGRTYRMLDKKYVADHAGLSMWNGQTDISRVSIGIELVGYHYTPITTRQYRSIGLLIEILQGVYHLDDRSVLTHSQVAYGEPNRWMPKKHRGRKKCAKNFDRTKAGLGPTWPFDPDVKAGRLAADRHLAAVFYTPRRHVTTHIDSNVITAGNTAWSIAGEDYDSPTTLYRFPDGRMFSGDKIQRLIGWNRIPKNTVVLLNQEERPDAPNNKGPIKTIANGLTAWSFAGQAYKDKRTFYFFPRGGFKNGQQISDWDDLPSNTKMIIGYARPRKVTRRMPPLRIAGERYNHKNTIYYFPGNTLRRGDSIKDFKKLPAGVLVFLPIRPSVSYLRRQ